MRIFNDDIEKKNIGVKVIEIKPLGDCGISSVGRDRTIIECSKAFAYGQPGNFQVQHTLQSITPEGDIDNTFGSNGIWKTT